MRHLKLPVALLFIFSIAVSVAAQPNRRVSAVILPDKAETAVEDDPLANFGDEGLPDPAILGLQPSAELAARVAARILKFEPESLAVLTAALQKAGFHIIGADQKILYRPTSTSNGAAFYDFEVAGMLRATGFGAVTTVEKLGQRVANNDPDLTRLDFPKLLLKDLRTARSSKDPQTQFIAALIFELGKKTADLSSASPASARINLIQASLIERLFLGDLLDAFETFSEQNASLMPRRGIFASEVGVQFLLASRNIPVPTDCALDDITKVVGMEGKIKKVAGKVFDKESIPSIFTAPKEAIKKRFEKVAKGIEIVNTVMAYAKIVLANMNMKADLTVEDPMPLIRTKSGQNYGEERIVTAKFKIDFKNADTINCVGKAVKAATGLEVEAPKDGPMKEVPVKWQPVLEGGNRYTRQSDYPVQLDSLDPKRRDLSKQLTNDLGENRIKLTGKPQARNMQNEPVVPMAKKADLTVSVATENMDAKEDIPKVFWFGMEGDFGLKAFIDLIPEIASKMALKTFKVTVPVRDWQPCSEDWGGYINYTEKRKQTIVVKANRSSNGNSTGEGIRRIEKEVTVNIVLNPRTPEDIVAKKDPRPADFRVRGRYSDIFDGSREGDPCCGPEEGKYSTKFRSGKEEKFFGTFQKRFGARFTGGDRDYSLAFDFSTNSIESNKHSFMEILDTNCPLEYIDEKSEDSVGQVTLSDSLPEGRYPDRFLNSAGDLLRGTKNVPFPDGSVTWEWALVKCTK